MEKYTANAKAVKMRAKRTDGQAEPCVLLSSPVFCGTSGFEHLRSLRHRLVQVSILCSAEEEHMWFRSYRRHDGAVRKIYKEGVSSESTVNFVVFPPQALSDPDPSPLCF